MKDYPEIGLKINESGLSFQIQFIKKDYIPSTTDNKLETVLVKTRDQDGTKAASSWHQVGTKS